MSRRSLSTMARCQHEGCSESGLFEYTSQRDMAAGDAFRASWRCTRHRYPDELVQPNSLPRTVGLTVVVRDGLCYWLADGSACGSGFVHGPGWRAFANDFPEGTRIEMDVRVVLPEVVSAISKEE